MNKQILANLSLRINVKVGAHVMFCACSFGRRSTLTQPSVCSRKVGGRNTVLADAVSRCISMVTDRSTIIFGADVTHPHPGEDSSPSIAAVS